MADSLPLDKRGYAGSERNRQLDPNEVIWARTQFAQGAVTPRQLARQFGLGIESVRRMLRGDTYANIGEALPRAEEVKQATTLDDGGALRRLLRESEALPPPLKPAEVDEPSGEEVVERFLKDKFD